jgi:hypothetical protein
VKIDLIPTYFGAILYDIYLDGHWIGSRRTVDQCWEYIRQVAGPA